MGLFSVRDLLIPYFSYIYTYHLLRLFYENVSPFDHPTANAMFIVNCNPSLLHSIQKAKLSLYKNNSEEGLIKLIDVIGEIREILKENKFANLADQCQRVENAYWNFTGDLRENERIRMMIIYLIFSLIDYGNLKTEEEEEMDSPFFAPIGTNNYLSISPEWKFLDLMKELEKTFL